MWQTHDSRVLEYVLHRRRGHHSSTVNVTWCDSSSLHSTTAQNTFLDPDVYRVSSSLKFSDNKQKRVTVRHKSQVDTDYREKQAARASMIQSESARQASTSIENSKQRTRCTGHSKALSQSHVIALNWLYTASLDAPMASTPGSGRPMRIKLAAAKARGIIAKTLSRNSATMEKKEGLLWGEITPQGRLPLQKSPSGSIPFTKCFH